MRLDRKQPYGTIHGGTGPARFTQNDRQFDVNGREVFDDPIEEPVKVPLPAPVPPPVKVPAKAKPAPPPIEIPPSEPIPDSEYAKLPIVQLKQILASYQEPYLSKAQAVRFIDAKRAK